MRLLSVKIKWFIELRLQKKNFIGLMLVKSKLQIMWISKYIWICKEFCFIVFVSVSVQLIF